MAPKTQTEEHEIVVPTEVKRVKTALTSESFIARWSGQISFPLLYQSEDAVVSHRPFASTEKHQGIWEAVELDLETVPPVFYLLPPSYGTFWKFSNVWSQKQVSDDHFK